MSASVIEAFSHEAMALGSMGVSVLTSLGAPDAAQALIGPESDWPLWTALPVAPYKQRKTIRREVGPGIWAFDQIILRFSCFLLTLACIRTTPSPFSKAPKRRLNWT